MLSQNAKKNADKCRFCWMCRHLCPVQLKTGKEINTPRAKGLLISMIERETAKFDADVAKVMYECMLCDACVNDCATGYRPPVYIREARSEAVARDLAPAGVMKTIENIEKTGNIYGEEKPEFGKHDPADVLVYIGEVAALRAPKMAEAFLGLLDKAGVKYMTLKDEPASGVMLGDLCGYVSEVTEQAEKCAAAINESGAKKIIVLDSYDAQIMTEVYPQQNVQIKGEIVTATAFAAELLKEGKIAPKKAEKGLAAYHDDDRLARVFHEFEPARELAKAAGFELVEMFNKERLAKSCGCSVVKAYMPELVKLTAEGRFDDLKRTEARIILTANPESYECLSDNVSEGCEVKDIFTELYKMV